MREAASFIASRSGSSDAGLLQSILQFAGTIARSWQSRREVARLRDFDDHMLCDIGLTRGDLRETLELPFSSDLGGELQSRARRNDRHGWNA